MGACPRPSRVRKWRPRWRPCSRAGRELVREPRAGRASAQRQRTRPPGRGKHRRYRTCQLPAATPSDLARRSPAAARPPAVLTRLGSRPKDRAPGILQRLRRDTGSPRSELVVELPRRGCCGARRGRRSTASPPKAQQGTPQFHPPARLPKIQPRRTGHAVTASVPSFDRTVHPLQPVRFPGLASLRRVF